MDPSKLKASAAKLFEQALANADPEKISPLMAARTYEIAAKVDGSGNGETMLARSFVDRLQFISEVQSELRRRGLSPSQDGSFEVASSSSRIINATPVNESAATAADRDAAPGR